MTSRLDITTPATITVLAGNGTLSSLAGLPPGSISITDPDTAGTITAQVVAGNASAALSASGLDGATVSSNGATLSLTGTESEINAALASLEVIEPDTATQDVLTLTAGDPAVLPAQTDILVEVAPTTGPAFVAPPLIVTLQPNALDAVPGLLLSDPIASALAEMGLGREDTLNLTLSVASGILLLPGYSDSSAITATGLGTGTIELSLTADDIGALNALLAGLEFAGPAGGGLLDYTLRNASGVLPTALTFGDIFLNVAGMAGTNGTLTAGSQNVVLGGETLSGTATITGTTSVLGNISGAGSVVVAPDANLELPDNALFLGGTSLDFGTIEATTLVEAGTLIVADEANFAGAMLLGTAALLDFTGMLVAGGAETEDFQEAISLAAGAVLTGSGTLEAGNFSESGLIAGPGAILAEGGETLLISAGSVGGGTDLEVAAGGVMVLGPVAPLFGIFDATPLTIDSSVTLSFLGNAGDTGITGIYAGTLGGAGGAFVINGPQAFSGTIIGFEPGDQLIFPGLSDFSILNIAQGSFTVAGLDDSGSTVSYILHAAIPTGATLAAGFDAEGDPDIELRPAGATVTQDVPLAASAGIAQPLQGLNLQLATGTTQSLRLTLSVSHGIIGGNGITAGATISLAASSLSALNAELAALTYTGTGVNDAVTIGSETGILSGLLDFAVITATPSGTVNGFSETGFSEAQTASFGSTSDLSIIANPIAPGEIVVDGIAEFADALQVNGLSGTALLADGGGSAIFDAVAAVALGANVTVGDASGAGTLAIVTDAFSSTGNLTLAAVANAAGSAVDVLGAMTLAGTLNVGDAAAATLELGGNLSAGASSLGGFGTIFAYGSATANFGGIDNAGAIILDGASRAFSSAVMQSGALTLGGTSSLDVSGLMNLDSGGTVQIGSNSVLDAGTISQAGQGILDAGTLAVATAYLADAPIQLSGGTIEAESLTLGSGGLLAGNGSVDAGTIQSAGTIEAAGGVLTLSGSIGNSAAIEIHAAAALDIAGGLTGGPEITFLGADAVLTVDDPSRFGAGAQNMVGTDAIDLVGEAPGLVSYASGIVTIFDSMDNVLSTFSLAVAAGQPGLSVVSDGHGGALITLGDEIPCFARGTRLLTPHGYRAVETLKPGDPLVTASGGKHPVCWIGRRTLDLGSNAAWPAFPVLIMPDAFGPGLPARPLRLSPLHCVYADGALVPVTHLVNGATIIRETGPTALTYFHVELDQHDILLAEGLPCESYFDTGNRGALYHELGQRSPAKHAFAPSVTTGEKLAAIRRRLHDNALAAGFSLTYWPHLRAVASGQTVPPEITMAGGQRLARFTFPAPAKDITLLSSVASPADTDPDSEDRRELGVCLDPSAKVRLGQGWHARAPEDAGVWMGRVSSLHLDQPVTELQLPLAAITQSWVKPAVDARRRPA